MMIKELLSNRASSLMDLDFNQKQQILDVSSSVKFLSDYNLHCINPLPKE